MPTMWRVGAFVERYPRTAADLGRSYATASRAARALHDSAGTAAEETFAYQPMPGECCREPDGSAVQECGDGTMTCCTLGTCTQCRPDHDDFETIYPEPEQILDAAHAFQAAMLDILADPSVEDVGAAVAQATELHKAGGLLGLYQPAPPARQAPDGEPYPARCPVCGSFTCESCGCVCECCDAGSEAAPMQEEQSTEAD